MKRFANTKIGAAVIGSALCIPTAVMPWWLTKVIGGAGIVVFVACPIIGYLRKQGRESKGVKTTS